MEYMCVCEYMYICIHICVYICTHIHVFIHIQACGDMRKPHESEAVYICRVLQCVVLGFVEFVLRDQASYGSFVPCNWCSGAE